jgi:hypothetical protein
MQLSFVIYANYKKYNSFILKINLQNTICIIKIDCALQGNRLIYTSYIPTSLYVCQSIETKPVHRLRYGINIWDIKHLKCLHTKISIYKILKLLNLRYMIARQTWNYNRAKSHQSHGVACFLSYIPIIIDNNIHIQSLHFEYTHCFCFVFLT